MQMSADMDLHI